MLNSRRKALKLNNCLCMGTQQAQQSINNANNSIFCCKIKSLSSDYKFLLLISVCADSLGTKYWKRSRRTISTLLTVQFFRILLGLGLSNLKLTFAQRKQLLTLSNLWTKSRHSQWWHRLILKVRRRTHTSAWAEGYKTRKAVSAPTRPPATKFLHEATNSKQTV
jgi:hypothetical protein